MMMAAALDARCSGSILPPFRAGTICRSPERSLPYNPSPPSSWYGTGATTISIPIAPAPLSHFERYIRAGPMCRSPDASRAKALGDMGLGRAPSFREPSQRPKRVFPRAPQRRFRAPGLGWIPRHGLPPQRRAQRIARILASARITRFRTIP
jgi:hypothetical protein